MKVSLSINGIEVQAEEGTTVLQAATDNGIYIPRLCYHPKLPPYGGCRLCVVEIEKMRGFPTACTTPVGDGMVVRTETEEVQKLRRNVLRLILAEHPYTCLVCERRHGCEEYQGTIRKVGVTTGCQYCPSNGQCELQELVEYLQLEDVGIPIFYRGLSVEKEDPFFDRDYNLCILCGRCVRVCQEVRHNGVLAFTHRGTEALVGTAFDRSHLVINCEFCGACVDVCPTGALADKISKWEGKPASSVATICPYCSVGCALNLNLKDGQVIGSRPRDESPVNQGQVCVRGRFAVVEIVHNFERLTTPLVRNEEGRLVEATWEEALDLVASKFAEYRPDQFALIASAKCSNEDNYILQKFSRAVMGSNNVDFASALPYRCRTLPTGNNSPSVQDIAGAACIVVIGSDVCNSHPIAGLQVREAVAGGSRLVVIDPRRTKLSGQAAAWLRPAPGSDLWLLAGMLKTLLDGKQEPDQALAGLDMEAVEKATGVSQEQLSEALELMMCATCGDDDKPLVFLFGSGITHYPTAGESVKAIHNLAKLLGGKVLALVGEGNLVGAYDMGARPDYLPGYLPLADAEARARYEQAWGCALSETPGLSYRQILRGVADGEVKALYLVGETPPLPVPQGGYALAGVRLEGLEFLVVQDVLPNANLERADVVLPAASFAEIDGTFTNAEGRVQRLSKAIDPPGLSRPDWWIACRVAQAMDNEGFDFDHPAQVMAEIAELVPGYGQVAHESLEDGGLLRTIAQDDGELLPLSLDVPPKITSSEYPFTLIVERNLFHYRGAALTEQVQGMALIKDEKSLGLNPQDAADLGLVNGDEIVVISEQGRTETTVRTAAELPPGVASISANGVKGSGLFAEMFPGRKAYAVRIERG